MNSPMHEVTPSVVAIAESAATISWSTSFQVLDLLVVLIVVNVLKLIIFFGWKRVEGRGCRNELPHLYLNPPPPTL